MPRTPVPYAYGLDTTLARLARPGLLLASTDRSGRSNVMTIGWGVVGIIWGRPVFVVLVRPSRYTYRFIEDAGRFSVNVPAPGMDAWVAYCGSHSGRDVDKFAEGRVITTVGPATGVIVIEECPMVYECRVVHHNDVIPPHLDAAIEQRAYGGGDYHRLYYGEILGAYAASEY